MFISSQTVIEIVTIVANIAIALSLIFLLLQVRMESRELRYNSYEKLMSDFSNAALMLVEHSVLRDAFVSGDEPYNWRKYTEAERALYFYFDSLLGLFERVWVSYKEAHLMAQDDWEQWKNWISELSMNSVFVDVLGEAKEDRLYDPSFIIELEAVVAQSRKKGDW
jgi:hypothetical protein